MAAEPWAAEEVAPGSGSRGGTGAGCGRRSHAGLRGREVGSAGKNGDPLEAEGTVVANLGGKKTNLMQRH